ncbi:hypothetical protein [Hydrogenophaga sp. T2]|uniref:hypothetical protein n=1 Tax=Hydrogenophaga sp. T2 TaxID=3132823 RepID=UPI003CE79DBA
MTRSLLLYGGLAATLMAVWYTAGLDADAPADELLAPARRAAAPGAAVPAAPAPAAVAAAPIAGPVVRMGEERMAAPRGALMGARDWRPPPPPPAPAPAVAAAPPRAPQLPFQYLGRLDDEGGTRVFLSEGNQARPHVVRVGDRLRDYQVESISAQGMGLIYLPLNQKQQLLFGSAP